MSSVLADFTAQLITETPTAPEPTTARIILGSEQLVLAVSENEKEVVPLSDIMDINPGSVPQIFESPSGKPVTTAYTHEHNRQVALIAGNENAITKFTSILFKTILNGTNTIVKHPAKLGGRTVDSDFRGGILGIKRGLVRIDTEEGPITIDTEKIIDFNRDTRSIDGTDRPVLIADHMRNGEAISTIIAANSGQTFAILGRFLRIQYSKHMSALQQLSLSEEETELLTTIYSTGEKDTTLAKVTGIDPQKLKSLLHALHEKELIESNKEKPVLTSKGQVVVNQYLERVNN